MAAVLGAVALTSGDDAGENGAVDCETFAFDRAQWREAQARRTDGDLDRLHALARGLEACETLEGRPAPAVRSMLGAPALTLNDGRRWSYSLGERDGSDPTWLAVAFDGGRAVSGVTVVDPVEG